MSDIILTDRTSIETDWTCGRKYWWYKFEGGTGIVSKIEADYFLDGRDMHADLAAIARGASIESVIEAIPAPDPPTQTALERWTRRRAWVAAFALYQWPSISSWGSTVMIEQELILRRDPLWIACIPDLVQRESGGKLRYVEYKGVGQAGPGWILHWPYAIQHHIGLKALEEEFNEKVGYGVTLGVVKGQVRDGRLTHPYVWAYRRGEEWACGHKRDWDHAPVWEFEPGIIEWVKRCGPEVGAKQFIWSEPIFLDNRLVDVLVRERTKREREIRGVRPLIAENGQFAHNFEACRPVVGPPCPYLAACHNATVNADPLASGLYTARTPHHQAEGIDLGDI